MEQSEVLMLRATSRWAAKDVSEETAINMLLDAHPKQGKFHVDAKQGSGEFDVTTTMVTTSAAGRRDTQVIVPTYAAPVANPEFIGKTQSISTRGPVVGAHTLRMEQGYDGQQTQNFSASGALRNSFSTSCTEGKNNVIDCLTTVKNPSGDAIGMVMTSKSVWPDDTRAHHQVFNIKSDGLWFAGTVDMRVRTHNQDQSMDFNVQRARRTR